MKVGTADDVRGPARRPTCGMENVNMQIRRLVAALAVAAGLLSAGCEKCFHRQQCPGACSDVRLPRTGGASTDRHGPAAWDAAAGRALRSVNRAPESLASLGASAPENKTQPL